MSFDSAGIPDEILSSVQEAVSAHAASCYRAAAMMVRRTLEVLCDTLDAGGKNLEERIKQLRTKVVLPEALFEGMNEIRFLGNDAAHIESRHYAAVGKAEVEAAIEFTTMILKSLYQLDDLVKKMQALKTTSSAPN